MEHGEFFIVGGESGVAKTNELKRRDVRLHLDRHRQGALIIFIIIVYIAYTFALKSRPLILVDE